MKLLVFAKQSPLKTDGSMKSTGLDVGTNYDFNFSECVARLQVRVRAQPCVTVGRALYNFSIGGNIHTHTHIHHGTCLHQQVCSMRTFPTVLLQTVQRQHALAMHARAVRDDATAK